MAKKILSKKELLKEDVFICPHCGKEIEDKQVNKYKASKVGRGTSTKKAASSAKNGKQGGRPPLIIKKKNIIVKETKKSTSIVGGKKVSDPHVTGWTLSYKFPDGTIIKEFYQKGFYDKKRAIHVFYKTCVEPRQAEYERGNK